MTFRQPLLNFSKGEISEEMQGRFDVNAYGAALRLARNVVVLKRGGVRMRPGFTFVAECYDSATPARLIEFSYSYEQSYALVFEQGIMRPAALGGMVTEAEYEITGATQTNPIVIELAYHPYASGDEIYLTGFIGMTELNNRIVRVLFSIDASHFSIAVDGTGYGAFAGCANGVALAAPVPPPPPPPVVPPVVPPPAPPVVVFPPFPTIWVP